MTGIQRDGHTAAFVVRTFLGAVLCLALHACSTQTPVPDWSLKASDAAQRAMAAQLEGELRVAAQEWRNAQTEISKTGQPGLVARLALMRCAMRVASLDWARCDVFDAVVQDASPEDAAYARYLYGGLQAADVPLLPAAHQPVAQTLVAACAGTGGQLQAVKDAHARMVAAAAALRMQCLSPEEAWPAVDSVASAQGWRLPLMAWMVLLQQRAQQAGDAQAAELLERRLAVLQWQPAQEKTAP